MFEEIEIAKLAAQMNGEPEDNQTDEELDTDEHDIEDDEVDQETEDDEDTDEDTEGDGEDDSEESDEDEPEPESKKDPVVKWKTAAGEDFSVPMSELKNGYMRNKDYTQNSQALAKERETMAAQAQTKFQLAEQYAQELGALSQHDNYIRRLEADVQQYNRQDDPIGYNSAVSELLMARQQRDGLATRIAQVQQTRTSEQQQAFVEAQKQAVKQLAEGPDALPGFGKEMVQKLNETGKAYGLSDQELSGITDAKYIRILHDAMKYRELQSKKPAAVSKAKQAPSKRVRSVTPSKTRRIIEQFDKNPSIESMAALMNATKR